MYNGASRATRASEGCLSTKGRAGLTTRAGRAVRALPAPPCPPRGSPMGQELAVPGCILHRNPRILPPPCQPALPRGSPLGCRRKRCGPSVPSNEGRRLGQLGRRESTSSSYLAADFNNHNIEDWSQIAGGERPRWRQRVGAGRHRGRRWGKTGRMRPKRQQAETSKFN